MVKPKVVVILIRFVSRLGQCCADFAASGSLAFSKCALASPVKCLSVRRKLLYLSSKLLYMALELFVDKFFANARPTAISINFQQGLPFLQCAKFSNVAVPHSHDCFARFFYCGRSWSDFDDI